MKKQITTPYLPLDVCEPDGEPHVFGNRVYVFSSHDTLGGSRFCNRNYEFFSAPVDDLTIWTSRGISYDKSLDPDVCETGKYPDLYAPDVVQGNDGRFYLYYAPSGGSANGFAHSFTDHIHVAVADAPDGPYHYHGCVRNPDGTPFQRGLTFDPGVINDDGIIRMYYGWGFLFPAVCRRGPLYHLQDAIMNMVGNRMFDLSPQQKQEGYLGAYTVTLAEDMLTVTSEPIKILPGQKESFGTPWEGHAFFEASSIRKIGNIYYFIYSSEAQHELCYATSPYPDRDFRYGGVIISNGDIGYHGRKPKDRLAATGNNHGSIEYIHGQWYVFYHRHTHLTQYSRQGCAEKIKILPDGSIPQVEMTSCGLNDGPLLAEGTYCAAICCNLTNGNMPHTGGVRRKGSVPFITHDEAGHFITDITNGTLIGYKYFTFSGKTELTLEAKAEGTFEIQTGDRLLGEISFSSRENWEKKSIAFSIQGTMALYLKFSGKSGAMLRSFTFGQGV
ncbi:MAG: family 43 glycosylhydrolase [Faecousia sp.]